MVTANWPRIEESLGCGSDKPSPLKNVVSIPLSSLGLQHEDYTSEMLKNELEASLELPPETYDIWRWRTIYTLAQNESIFCINFIPTNPHEVQIIHVMRWKGAQQDAQSFPVFCHDLRHFKFVLPVKNPDQVFDLSKKKVSETIDQFEPSIKSVIEKALNFFSQDSRLQGLALTLESKTGTPATYIWLKGISTVHL